MDQRKSLLEYSLLIILALVWGSSFILMKKGLESFTPIEIAAYRMFSAGVVLLPVFIYYVRLVPKRVFGYFFISGLIGNGLPAFMFVFAQTRLSSSVTGALNALTPLFTLLIGMLVFGVRLNRFKTWGVMVGLAGAIILILLRPGAKVSGDTFYALLVVLAALFYGINVNLIKQKLSDRRPMVVAAFPIVFMAIPSAFILYFAGFFSKINFGDSVQTESLLYITLLGVVGTALSLVAFNRLIQMTNAIFASFVTYLIPVVALLWGFADNESINGFQIFGLVLILIGVVMVNKKGRPVSQTDSMEVGKYESR